MRERQLRALMPAWQQYLTSDDYTEYCWHCPTVRLFVARPSLAGPAGYVYPAWVANALGGIRETIDPMIRVAAKTIGATLLDCLTQPSLMAEARREFVERTGGRHRRFALAGGAAPPRGFQGPASVPLAGIRHDRAR